MGPIYPTVSQSASSMRITTAHVSQRRRDSPHRSILRSSAVKLSPACGAAGDESVRRGALCRGAIAAVQNLNRVESDVLVRLAGEAHLGDLIADDLRSFNLPGIE